MPTSSASSREMKPTPCARARKNGLSSSRPSYSPMRLSMTSIVSRHCVRPSCRDVVAHAADLVEAVEQARADQRLEQVEDHLALADAVEEDRRAAAERAAHVHAPRAEPEQVRGDPLQLGGDHAQILRALRHFDLADLLGRQHVGELARHRRDVVGLRRDRRVLRVGQRLGQLLVAAVQIADHRVDADDRFALEREDGAEHAVGRRVLRPHVHRQALAAGVVELDACGCRVTLTRGCGSVTVSRGSSVGRVRRIDRVGLQERMAVPVVASRMRRRSGWPSKRMPNMS